MTKDNMKSLMEHALIHAIAYCNEMTFRDISEEQKLEYFDRKQEYKRLLNVMQNY